jgi:hypothetical protein
MKLPLKSKSPGFKAISSPIRIPVLDAGFDSIISSSTAWFKIQLK